jgi:hypothetical protein
MTTYKIFDICWDLDYYVDEADLNLKPEYEVTIDFTEGMTAQEKEDVIIDRVSEMGGFCIFTAQIEPALEDEAE